MGVVVYLVVGMFAGLCSGLLGLGGGVVVVPALFYLFSHAASDLPTHVVMHVAIGTSLAVMVVTASASTWVHARQQTVCWSIWRRWLVGLLLGSVLGVVLAAFIPTVSLQYTFSCFLLYVALRMLFNLPPKSAQPTLTGALWPAVGVLVGLFSGLLGVGGGVLMVPFLSRYGLKMSQSAGTAAASTLPVALCGAITHIIAGWSATTGVTYCVGFVYLPAFMAIVPSTFLMVPVGAKLSKRLPGVWLKRIFAVFLIVIVVDMVM